MGFALAALYAARIPLILESVITHERGRVEEAAALVHECRRRAGILHVFGAGHSQLVATDATYRAASPAWATGVLDPGLSVARGALASSAAESIAENAAPALVNQRLSNRDATIVVCNSGTTPVSVAWASACAERGLPVISVVSRQSLEYFRDRGRTSLEGVSGVLIDNHCPVGDAVIQEEQAARGVLIAGPSSTIINTFILHWLLVHVVQYAIDSGEEAETFRSGHLEGARTYNEALMETYRDRIKVY